LVGSGLGGWRDAARRSDGWIGMEASMILSFGAVSGRYRLTGQVSNYARQGAPADGSPLGRSCCGWKDRAPLRGAPAAVGAKP
jgi:hypothetical protein